LQTDEERKAKILGSSPMLKKNVTSFSILRISFANETFHVQKNALKKLDSEQKEKLKNQLRAIIQEID